MENFPKPVSITMQPYDRNTAGSPGSTFGPTVNTFAQPQRTAGPRDFVLWSFFNTIFCNPFCLGFIALVWSIKVRGKSLPPHHSPAWLGAPTCCLHPPQGSLILPLPFPSHPVLPCPTPPNPILSHLVPFCPSLP
ncbi:IFM3 protein, partial [Eubucco bourcierii]|nr:IFM3 protein [Eubucco bourcierii]